MSKGGQCSSVQHLNEAACVYSIDWPNCAVISIVNLIKFLIGFVMLSSIEKLIICQLSKRRKRNIFSLIALFLLYHSTNPANDLIISTRYVVF